MPNSIKYSASAQTLALKKGNFWIGTGDVGKGPTSTTDYWNGITPPAGGYTIYLNKSSGGPSIYTAANDSALISLSNTIAGQTFATAAAALAWFATQTDKMVFNIDYPAIVTNGLVFNTDAGFIPSYPTTGTTWYDVSSSGNNGTLTNGPAFNSGNGGSIVFDGVDDKILGGSNTNLNFGTGDFTVIAWIKTSRTNNYQSILTLDNNSSGQGLDYYTEITTGQLRTWVGGVVQVGKTSVCTGSWVFTGVSRISGTVYQYVNGTLDNSASQPGSMLSDQSVKMGVSDANQYYFSGNIGAVQIYSRGLSSQEISQNYNSTKSRFGL